MNQPDFRDQQPGVPPSPDVGPTDRQVYNLVTDTLTGLNIRLRDNLYQGAYTAICAVLGVPLGWLITRLSGGNAQDQIGFAIVGGFVGLVFGLFSSGIFLMFFRAIRHMRGKHD